MRGPGGPRTTLSGMCPLAPAHLACPHYVIVDGNVCRIMRHHCQFICNSHLVCMTELVQNTIDLSDEIMSRHHFLTLRDTGEVLHFDGSTYNLGGEHIIREEIERLAGKRTRYTYSEILAKVKHSTYVNRDVFDDAPMFVNTVGGILYMTKRWMLPHDPTRLFRNKLNARYDPTTTPTRFMRFLSEVIEDPHDR